MSATRKLSPSKAWLKTEKLYLLQKAFVEHDAVQCGFCTPGIILSAYSLLNETPHPSREQIMQGMDEIVVPVWRAHPNYRCRPDRRR